MVFKQKSVINKLLTIVKMLINDLVSVTGH